MKEVSALERYMVKKGHDIGDIRKGQKKSKKDEDKVADDKDKELPSKIAGTKAEVKKDKKKASSAKKAYPSYLD